ncbi:MAG: LysR family transcriptional regulator [Alphaproteobacteria bacterium]|nr:LysR family transcriptional regulator [Alphaproteobacteria bacterium]
MSIKSKTILFRNLLYLNEVIKFSQINAAAEKNGIKASNLSKIIKDLEDYLQKQLFIRTSNGLIPTTKALELSQMINQTETAFDEIIEKIAVNENKKSLQLYIPDNIELKNLQSFKENKIIFCSSSVDADVIVSYEKPQNYQNLIMVENCIGTEFKQKIWVSSKNSKQALNLSRFIICQMHL